VRITCPNCRSEYAFDRDRVSGNGTKVKCSACAHVFTVFRPDRGPESIDDVRRLRDTSGSHGPGLFFRQEGKTYPVRDLSTLQRWIIEKRVLATDEVSADGETWESVVRVAELRPFFDLIRQLRETRRELQYTRDRLRGYVTGEHAQVSADDEDDAGEPEVHATREVMEHVPADEDDGRLVHLSVPGAQPDPEDLVEPESAEFHAISSEGYSEVVDSSTGDAHVGADGDEEPQSLRQQVVGSAEPQSQEPLADDAVSEDEQVTAGISVDGAGKAGDTADMVTAESPQVEDRGADSTDEGAPTEAELLEALAGDARSGPIPRLARETMSRLAAEGIEEPRYDPSAQSVIVEPSLSGDEAALAEDGDEPVELDQRAEPENLEAGPAPLAWSSVDGADDQDSEESGPPPVSFGEPDMDWGTLGSGDGAEAAAEGDGPGGGDPSEEIDDPSKEPSPSDERPAPQPSVEWGSESADDEPSGEPSVRDERPPPPPSLDWGSESADDEPRPDAPSRDAATEGDAGDAGAAESSEPDSTPVLEDRIASMWDSMEGSEPDFGESQEPSPSTPSGDTDQLGQEFERFERSFRESKVDGDDEDSVSVVAPAAAAWESDDFDDQQFDYEDSVDEESDRSRLWMVLGAVVLVLAIGGGTWYAVRAMKTNTDRKLDWVAEETPAGDVEAGAGTPADVAGDGAVAGGEAGTGEPGQETPGEDAAADAVDAEEVTPEPEAEEPTEAVEEPEPVTPEPPTPAPERDEREEDRPEPVTPAPAFELIDVGDGSPEPTGGEDPTQKGDDLSRKGQYAEAIQAYQKALDANSKNTRALRGLGWAYIEIGSAVQASEHFQRAVMLESMNAEAHYGLGLAYEQLGRREQAINEYQTYIGLAPNGREATEVRILLRRLLESNP